MAVGLIALISSGVEDLSAQTAAGPEFRVNTYTTGAQAVPAIASSVNGDFVVVWNSWAEDGSGYGVFGQLYDSSGTPHGGEFLVGSSTIGSQSYPTVAWSNQGQFMVAWQGVDNNGYGIFARRFTAAGVPQGAEFQVNTYVTDSQNRPAIAVDGSGNFKVVWVSNGQDGAIGGIFGQRLDALGAKVGTEFQVNTYTTGGQYFPSIAADGAGDFVVTWYSPQDGSAYGVYAQRYNAAGVRQGGEFRVNSETLGTQTFPTVAMEPSGNFNIVWDSFSDAFHLFGQRYDASGATLGGQFQINTYTSGYQVFPVIASDAAGDFVVTWQGGGGEDGDLGGIFARRFDASGLPVGSEFQVSSYTTGRQTRARVAVDPDGDFVIAWESPGEDGSDYGIFGQRFGDLIFQDNFEASGLARWSAASTDGTNLDVAGIGALAGTGLGLRAFVNDTNPLYVQDDRPQADSRYRARFYFDPNGFDPGEASAHFRIRIFIAFDDSNRRAFAVVLKRQNGVYGLMGRVRRNDGTRVDTGFIPISNQPHFVEVDWQRASAPGVADGSFEFWIDGVERSVLTGIDDDASTIETARLGAMSLKSGAAGTLYFDQFVSRRAAYIGPR